MKIKCSLDTVRNNGVYCFGGKPDPSVTFVEIEESELPVGYNSKSLVIFDEYRYYYNGSSVLERDENDTLIIAAKNREIVEKRRQRYELEVDPYKMESLEDDITNEEKTALKNLAKANKALIKQQLPKIGE